MSAFGNNLPGLIYFNYHWHKFKKTIFQGIIYKRAVGFMLKKNDEDLMPCKMSSALHIIFAKIISNHDFMPTRKNK